MKIARRLIFAALCLKAPAVRGATLGYTAPYRYLESGFATFEPADQFADLDMGVAGLDSMATQRSALGVAGIQVSSRITGFSERGASFFKITFFLNEPSAWSLTGSFELLGSTGFACVSIQDLAHQDTLIVNEVIYAPPLVAESRKLDFGGVLASGNYSLEAMIYGGGDSQSTRGGIDAVFSIPEPGAVQLLVIALLPRARRR